MIARILNVYGVELSKALRLRFTYVGPVLVILTVLAAPFAYPMGRDQASDYGFVAYAVQLSLNILGFFLLLIYCASLVSSEMGAGTIRMMLVRPLKRREFLLAKMMIGLTYATVLAVFASVTAWSLAFFAGNLSGVHYGGEVVYTNREMLTVFVRAILLGLLPLYAGVAYAIFISVCTKNTTSAVSIAAGLWIFVDTVKYPLNISPFFFTTYMEKPWTEFVNRANAITLADAATEGPNALLWLLRLFEQDVVTSLLSILVFLSLSLYVFSRRSLT